MASEANKTQLDKTTIFMKKIFLFALFLLVFQTIWAQSTSNLFPFRSGTKWGYLDTSGKELIPAIYWNAGDFSEGLAPVRVGGRYGYINADGNLQIAARFDFAEPFLNGLGKVWLGGKPFFVDKKGKQTYKDSFIKINGFQDGSERAIVTLHETNYESWEQARVGLIDRNGKFWIDSIFADIEKWTENHYICRYRQADSVVVATARHDTYAYTTSFPAICVLDSNGKVIIPPGLFKSIKRSDNQLALVEAIGETSRNDLKYVGLSGEVVVFPPERRFSEGKFQFVWSEQRAAGSLITVPFEQWKKRGYPMTAIQAGWFDLSGNFIAPDSLSEFTTPFQDGRAFGRCKRYKSVESERYFLYDERGARVGNRVFQHFFPFWNAKQQLHVPFWEGKALVTTASGVIELIDTLGNTLMQMQRQFYNGAIIEPFSKFWKFNDSGITMVWDCEQKRFLENPLYELEILPTQGSFMIRGGDYHGKLKYLDHTGRIVWQEQSDLTSPEPIQLNADQLVQGILYHQKPNPVPLADFQTDTVSFFIQPEGTISYPYKYKAFPAYLVNATPDTFMYKNPTCFLQVLNAQGQWQDILYHPVSWCGTDRDIPFYLPPGQCLEFAVPDLEGEIETPMRLCFAVHSKYFISNTFTAHINPGQLWRKPNHSRTGLLKPYQNPKW